jgi:uncharacterized membrane protein
MATIVSHDHDCLEQFDYLLRIVVGVVVMVVLMSTINNVHIEDDSNL